MSDNDLDALLGLDKDLITSMSDDDLDVLLGYLCDTLAILRKYVYSIADSSEVMRLALFQIKVFEEIKKRAKNKTANG
ncbi:MAG: hypothetical protein ACRCX2_01685 [Paraclostridium sp.]